MNEENKEVVIQEEKVETPKKKTTKKKSEAPVEKEAMRVKVTNPRLCIRNGAGTTYEKTGKHTGAGEFEITQIKEGPGSEAGWGKLKDGSGWISMDYAERI